MILIIHHLESMWDRSLLKLSGKGFFDWASELAEELSNGHSYSKIILTQFENFEPEDGHFETGLEGFVNDWHDYAYGWEHVPIGQEGDYTEGGSHSPFVYLPEWLKEFKGRDVKLCGAFDGECIEDMEIALKAVGASVERWEKFIV